MWSLLGLEPRPLLPGDWQPLRVVPMTHGVKGAALTRDNDGSSLGVTASAQAGCHERCVLEPSRQGLRCPASDSGRTVTSGDALQDAVLAEGRGWPKVRLNEVVQDRRS